MKVNLHFSDHFGIPRDALTRYGAFDISVVSDLPLFVDPFLLFNSERPKYQGLHEEILKYLRFLRDQARPDLDPGLIDNWYRFSEVKQNWLGFTLLGNSGSGLGADFARSLHGALGDILSDFGDETITTSSHLEKLCLIRSGVGRDNISDFTTNLIKGYLCEYTEDFAKAHLRTGDCSAFRVPRAHFNYDTESWVTREYILPRLRDDFVLLTPVDMLTRDDTWINYGDMIGSYPLLPEAVSDENQRAQINRYFARALGEEPNAKKRREAAADTIREFPELIDQYIRLREEHGDRAESVSAEKVRETERVLVDQIRAALEDLLSRTEFFDLPWTSYEEALSRAHYFKDYIENNDGYRLFNRDGLPFSTEEELQLAFGLVWCGSAFDINREVNNGRGPVDFKASYGAGDKSLIEFKLASNTRLKQNLEKQVDIYAAANRTDCTIKMIVCYTDKHQLRVKRILEELGIENEESVLVIDARSDNKPSASKA